MKLAKYGRREVIVATVVAASACALLALLAGAVGRPLVLLMAVPALLWLWTLWFFRDPDRTIPPGRDLLVSPADGRVSDVTQVGPDSPLGRSGVKIGIFMSVFDVHVNRSPTAAQVERLEHKGGAFLDARDSRAALANESMTIYMTHRRGQRDYPLVVRQIAGRIARRIVTDLTVGQTVAAGQRLGMIKFGSRVELFVPHELAGEVRVAPGRHVRAGSVVLVAAPEAPER